MERRRQFHPGLLAAGLVALTFATYAPVLGGGFVWDDPLLIGQNPLLTGEGRWISIWFQTDFPLSTMAFALLHRLWGEQPTGYHVVNVALHALNALLLWRVLATLGIRAAGLAAALFAVHPVCVASAAWISQLKNTLALAFALLSAWGWFESARQRANCEPVAETADGIAGRRRARWLYAGSVVAFALGLASKTAVVMWPVVLLGVLARWRGMLKREDLWRALPFFLLSLVFGLVTLRLQTFRILASEPVQTLDWLSRLAAAGRALWFYLGKLLVPVGLAAVYPQWEVNARSALGWLPLLGWCGLLAVGASRTGWARALWPGLGGFTVLLLPVLGLVDMYFLAVARVSDHLVYPASVCVLALGAAAVRAFVPERLCVPVSAVLVAVLAVLSFERARVFASDETLWADTLAKNPAAWLAHNNLGCIRAEQHRLEEAGRHFEASLRLNPRNTRALINLARLRQLRGDPAGAEALLQRAVALRPDDPEALARYGSLLLSLGRAAQAETYLRRALALRPEMTTRLELARACHAQGKTAPAVALYREALERNPNQIEALNNLAWLLATAPEERLRNGEEALRHARRACELTSRTNARLLGVLAAALAETGRFSNAVVTAQEAQAVAQAAGDIQGVQLVEELRRHFVRGQPYRMPVRPEVSR